MSDETSPQNAQLRGHFVKRDGTASNIYGPMDADTLAAIKAEHVPVMDEDAHYDVCACCDADWPCAASALVAEVERLRTACDALYADADRHANATIHAELEVERLRAALDEIDHHTYGWSFDTAVPMVDRIRLTARAALASDR